MVIGIGAHSDAGAASLGIDGERSPQGLFGDRQEVAFRDRCATHQPPAFSPVRHQRQAGIGSREGVAGRDPTTAAFLQGRQEILAVPLHLLGQLRTNLAISTEGSIEAVVPVVALKGPIEHDQAAGQTAIGDGFLEAEAGGAPIERNPRDRCGMARSEFPMQLAHHHPGG